MQYRIAIVYSEDPCSSKRRDDHDYSSKTCYLYYKRTVYMSSFTVRDSRHDDHTLESRGDTERQRKRLVVA